MYSINLYQERELGHVGRNTTRKASQESTTLTQQDFELKLLVLLLKLEKKLLLILLLLKLLLLERIRHNWDLIKATTTTPYKTLLNHTTWPNT